MIPSRDLASFIGNPPLFCDLAEDGVGEPDGFGDEGEATIIVELFASGHFPSKSGFRSVLLSQRKFHWPRLDHSGRTQTNSRLPAQVHVQTGAVDLDHDCGLLSIFLPWVAGFQV
jgi:hypothetical protein